MKRDEQKTVKHREYRIQSTCLWHWEPLGSSHDQFYIPCSTKSSHRARARVYRAGVARSIDANKNSNTFRPVLCTSTLPNQPKTWTHISAAKPSNKAKSFLCGAGNGPLIRLGIFAKNNPTPKNRKQKSNPCRQAATVLLSFQKKSPEICFYTDIRSEGDRRKKVAGSCQRRKNKLLAACLCKLSFPPPFQSHKRRHPVTPRECFLKEGLPQ